MIIEISYLTVMLFASIVGAIIAGVWALGRTFLQQYGSMLTGQLTAHQTSEAKRSGEVVRRLESIEDDFGARLADHAGRIARIEGAVSKAPSHEDLSKLYEKQNETARTLATLLGETKGQGETLRLILNQIAHKGMQ